MQLVDEPEFARAPHGKYVRGPTFLAWSASPRLFGAMDWGDPSDDDVRRMLRLVELLYRQPEPFDLILDSRHLLRVRLSTFEAMVRLVASHLADARRVIRRHAIIAPPNSIGALLAGFYPVLGDAAPRHRFFTRTQDVGQWLGLDATRALAFVADAARDFVPTLQPLTPLRAYLRDHLIGGATVDAAAAALGVSERTLQRQLQLHGSTFRRELSACRLERARAELLETNDKLYAVAAKVGFRQASHFVAWFRREVGLTPDAFRDRHRR